MRVSKTPQQRRAELVAAARRLFDEKGVAKTRVSDIVAQVGVAQGVFYYYFASKEEMVAEVTRQVGEEVDAKAGAILADGHSPFPQKLREMIDLVIELIDQFTEDGATRLPAADGPEAAGAPGRQVMHHLREAMHRLVAQGVAAGEVTAEYPTETVDVLIIGIGRLATERLPTREMVYSLAGHALGLNHIDDGGPRKRAAGRARPAQQAKPKKKRGEKNHDSTQ